MSERQFTLANDYDVFNFHPGMRGQFTQYRSRWRRFVDWLLRRKEPPPQVFRVTAVDRLEGVVTIEAL